MDRLKGRIALVTGGAMGLGQGIARRFVDEGAQVVLTDINEEAGAATAGELGAHFLPHDVGSEEQWSAVVAETEKRFGGLHILVNNAGTEGNADAAKDPAGAPLSDWETIFRVNAAGVFLGCRVAMPVIAASGGGSIVNLSSVASLVPTPFITAYGASKAAVDHLTRSVALHCARAGLDVRCNTVHPGQVHTPMLEGLFARMAAEAGVSPEAFSQGFLQAIPLGRYQEPVDIANAVLFLASDEARNITGQALVVDGGFTLSN
jgi:3(or 17)beta-hydroxysteroid dehydrogenase